MFVSPANKDEIFVGVALLAMLSRVCETIALARMSRVFDRGEIRQHCNFVYSKQLFVLINEDVTQAAVYPRLP